MNADNITRSLDEMKAELKGKFATVNDDKFTQVKLAELRGAASIIGWRMRDYKVLGVRNSAKSLSVLGSGDNQVELKVDYRRKDDTDAVFWTFIFQGEDSDFIGMEDLHVFLILDDSDRLELSEISGHQLDTKAYGGDKLQYLERAQLTVPIAAMIAIANAEKIDYRLQFTKLTIEDTFQERDLFSFKGFYNNVFDEDFEVEKLYKGIKAREAAEEKRDTEIESQIKAQKAGCYVATHVYGGSEHPAVMTLRQFRDETLLQSAIGRAFVSLYYRFSPQLVLWLQGKARTNILVRRMLDRIVHRLRRAK